MTAVLSSAGTHERIAEAVAECVRIGITVTPPDVNQSASGFELQQDGDALVIRFGLGTVKNVGSGAAENIVEARGAEGPFTNVEDFARRVDLRNINKRALESLVKCGALDSLGPRASLLSGLDRIVSLAQREAKLKESGQSTMFDMFGDSVSTPLPAVELPAAAEVSKAEALAWERELLGVYVSEHPFSGAAVKLAKHTSALVSEINEEMDGREVVIAGMVNDVRSRATKAGKAFLVVTVEDLSGQQEITVWPDVYETTRELWQPGNILLMLVRVRERGDRLQIAAQQVSIVQTADGSMSHEHFEVPVWLTDAVRTSAGVGVVGVTHDSGNGNGNGHTGARNGGNGRSRPNGNGGGAKPNNPAPVRKLLRFWLHESDDADDDRRRLDELVALIERHPGDDTVRLFIHARDHDRIELSMPPASISEELRAAGVALLEPRGGAEEIAEVAQRRTRGVEPLEV
jgi:DNA polymerase-3 subunit alpha